MTKDEVSRWENVLVKMQPSERYYELAFVFRRDARLQGRILVDHFRTQSQEAKLTKEKLGGLKKCSR